MSQQHPSLGDELGGRLPLLKPASLTTEQRALYDYLQETKVSWADESQFQAALPDGRLIGPFNAFLYSPEISRAFNGWVDAETKNTSLSSTVRQVIILTVGAVWNSAYEFYAHTAVGRVAGLSEQTIGSIKAGREPDRISSEEAAAYQYTRSLASEHAVDLDLYQLAVRTFGEKGVCDLNHLIGLYLATCALLNSFAIPAPTTTRNEEKLS